MPFTTPPAPPNSGNPQTFNDDADAFLGWLPVFVAELNAMGFPNIPVRSADGSAAAPSISFSSDTNTGVFRPLADTLSFATGGGERLRVSPTGAIVCGGATDMTQVTPAASNVPGIALRDNGVISGCAAGTSPLDLSRKNTGGTVINFRLDGTIIGSVTVNGTTTAYNTTSDYRRKIEDAAPAGYDPAATVKALAAAQRWFHFNFGDDAAPQIGWFAHELQEIEPRAVTGTKDEVQEIGTITLSGTVVEDGVPCPDTMPDGCAWEKTGDMPVYQGRDDSKLVPHLIAALANALARIEALEAQSA